MKQAIVGLQTDAEGHWVARLACGHNQHVRHDPPWQMRPWTQTQAGRAGVMGREEFGLDCRKCDQGAPRDWDL